MYSEEMLCPEPTKTHLDINKKPSGFRGLSCQMTLQLDTAKGLKESWVERTLEHPLLLILPRSSLQEAHLFSG